MLPDYGKSVIDVNYKNAAASFSDAFKDYVYSNFDISYKSLLFVCIGTDRSTGDSLGPIIGYKLCARSYKNMSVYGTLDDPVHAKNLTSKLNEIYLSHEKPFIVAIDACLGGIQNVGHINISKGPIFPGAGVNKDLLPVGDINITGIVNISGYMEYFILQNTRLSLVMKMADIITEGILLSMEEINKRLAAGQLTINN